MLGKSKTTSSIRTSAAQSSSAPAPPPTPPPASTAAEAAVPVSQFQGDQATAGINTISKSGVAGAARGAHNSSPLNMFPQVYFINSYFLYLPNSKFNLYSGTYLHRE